MIGAVEGSLFPVAESVLGSVPGFVAAFGPDCFSVSTGVVPPPEATGSLLELPELGSEFGSELEPAFTAPLFAVVGELSFCSPTEPFTGSTTAATGSEFDFEFEPAFTTLLFPVAGEPSFCAAIEGSTGSTTAATGSDCAVVGVAIPALLLPGSFAFTPSLGAALVAAVVGAATGDFKVTAGDGGAFSACGSAAGVGTGARAVAFCSTRGGS